ncbi:MAG TPA: glycosyltransferase family 39 protein, partial [Phycisphaerae bacterium]|nr:glycosyltransferase family 39 protein [Phycisphaerae bacterium]
MSEKSAGWVCTIAGIIAACASVAIGWGSIQHFEMAWDECEDHAIAVGLRHHPLTGGPASIDASQMRLPMYVNAAVYALTGRDDLAVSRAVSLAFGAVAVIAVAALGRCLFGPLVGGLAAVLTAFSPYFLSFARISMTEGDVFCACFTTLVLLGLVCYLCERSAARWLVSAVLLALALGAKIFAIALFAVFLVEAGLAPRPATIGGSGQRRDARRLAAMLVIAAAVMLATAVAAAFSQTAAICGWAVLLGVWTYTIIFVLKQRARLRGGMAPILGMIVLAIITCGVLMPAHLIQHDITRSLARRLLRWDHQLPLAHLSDHLRLYAGIMLIKLTAPLGILTAASLVWGVIRASRHSAWRLCTLTVVAYVAGLCLLPLRQTFYLMGVYPVMMIMTAALAAQIGQRLRRRKSKASTAWMIVIAVLLVHLGVNVYRAYPWYNLYGYELIGDRWLGAESRGYRNLIQTPSDGVESLIRWCNADE